MAGATSSYNMYRLTIGTRERNVERVVQGRVAGVLTGFARKSRVALPFGVTELTARRC